mmetsp:Transcript_5138/g.8873  ORF Transcript_5138/g.8873 Transcript_5138/m.8873 type:complete len:216 (-) Transcript_5138:303-950(-)
MECRRDALLGEEYLFISMLLECLNGGVPKEGDRDPSLFGGSNVGESRSSRFESKIGDCLPSLRESKEGDCVSSLVVWNGGDCLPSFFNNGDCLPSFFNNGDCLPSFLNDGDCLPSILNGGDCLPSFLVEKLGECLPSLKTEGGFDGSDSFFSSSTLCCVGEVLLARRAALLASMAAIKSFVDLVSFLTSLPGDGCVARASARLRRLAAIAAITSA